MTEKEKRDRCFLYNANYDEEILNKINRCNDLCHEFNQIKPSDIEQRNGRIIRQANEFDKVGVYNYVTENTFDAYLMNIIVTKQRFISQLMSGNATARSCEDVDEAVLNYSEMQALASGDDRIKEKIELDGDVARR